MDWNQSSYEPQNSVQPPVPEKKKPGFGIGFLVGGMVCLGVFILGVYLYIHLTNSRLILGNGGMQQVKPTQLLDDQAVDKISELMQYMDLYFYEDIDEEAVRNGMYAGIIDSLGDRYSLYYTPEKLADFQISSTGKYYGIGAGLSQSKDTMEVTITRVYEGTPAEEAGLMNEDIVIKADGIEATSVELSDLVSHIRGEEGTKVTMEIYRPSTKEYLTFEVERRNVELPSVSSQMLENDIGYIQLMEFQTGTENQFWSAYEKLKDDGMKSLIIDLRGNPGGLLSSVTSILDGILPEGLTVYTEDKYGNRTEYKSDKACIQIPMVVLIDGNSASASEIFAGAIKDYKYGILVGTKTYGKGIVQSMFRLKDGDAVKLTTARYFTPSGNYIHGVGIEPDVELEYEFLGGENDVYAVEFDNQIKKAIELLAPQ